MSVAYAILATIVPNNDDIKQRQIFRRLSVCLTHIMGMGVAWCGCVLILRQMSRRRTVSTVVLRYLLLYVSPRPKISNTVVLSG